MMKTKWILTWIMMLLRQLVECIKCFECDNKINPACGVEFKSYQFRAQQCEDVNFKCGLQRQEPTDNFIGILRRCYRLGQIQDMNESDGCHIFRIPPQNHSFELCFCSEDYCNASAYVMCDVLPILLCACLTYLIMARR